MGEAADKCFRMVNAGIGAQFKGFENLGE